MVRTNMEKETYNWLRQDQLEHRQGQRSQVDLVQEAIWGSIFLRCAIFIVMIITIIIISIIMITWRNKEMHAPRNQRWRG